MANVAAITGIFEDKISVISVITRSNSTIHHSLRSDINLPYTIAMYELACKMTLLNTVCVENG
jgi:hypothetical protein